jgi:hypothetical protein
MDTLVRANKRRLVVGGLAALLAVNAILFLITPSLAIPGSLANYFFGPGMIRAQVVLRDGEGIHAYRLDQGRIVRLAPRQGSLRIFESDGRTVNVRVAPDARIEVNGRPATFAALRRGMRATVVRDGERAAEIVIATGRE